MKDLNAEYSSVYDPKFNAATKKYKWISCLLYAGDNHLYVGTYDGIRCIDLSTDDFKTEEILSRHIIHSLYEDPQGNIWIGNSEDWQNGIPKPSN